MSNKKRETWQCWAEVVKVLDDLLALGMVVCGLPAAQAQRGKRGHKQEVRLTLFSSSSLRM